MTPNNVTEGFCYLANAPLQFGCGSYGRSSDRQQAIDRCVSTFVSDWGRPDDGKVHVYVAKVPDTDLEFYGSVITWYVGKTKHDVVGEHVIVDVPMPKAKRKRSAKR